MLVDADPTPVRTHRARRRRRTVLVTGSLALLASALVVLTMMAGSYRLSAWQVVASALHLENDPAVDFIVRELRLPVASAALAVGLALGMSGSIFQRLLANPLASPDFVGVSSGASLLAVASIVLFQASSAWISGSALLGALLSAALIYLLAWRDGIGISEFLLSIVGYLIAQADLYDAREAMTWLIGSVGQAGPGELRILLVALVLLTPVALTLAAAHPGARGRGGDGARCAGRAGPPRPPRAGARARRLRHRRRRTAHIRRPGRRADRPATAGAGAGWAGGGGAGRGDHRPRR
jgi:iron complex transport system permease protein